MDFVYKCVLFDLDGTLTDPQIGITTSVKYALMHEGIAIPEGDNLTWVIGPPLQESFQTLAASADEVILSRLYSRYRERYEPIGLYENHVYDGIVELLQSLNQSNVRCFIATSKLTVYAKRITDHFALTPYFEGIVGSELDGTRSAKADVIQHLLMTYGLIPDHCVMVGDRMHDVVGAQRSGLTSIGVHWGYGSHEELQTAGATYIVEKVADLRTLLIGQV